MAILIGDKSRFAVEVGAFCEGNRDLRRVDLWAANRWLTCDDNSAFISQFCGSVRRTINWLNSPYTSHEGGPYNLSLPFPNLSPVETHRRLLETDDGLRERYWFPHWGPTTDNVLGLLFRVVNNVVLTFEFSRVTHHAPAELDEVFTAELPEGELVQVLEQMLAILESGAE